MTAAKNCENFSSLV